MLGRLHQESQSHTQQAGSFVSFFHIGIWYFVSSSDDVGERGIPIVTYLTIAGILLLEPSTQFFIRRAAGMSTYQYIIHSMLAPALLEAPHHHTVLLVPLRHNMRARFLSKYDHDQRDSTTLLATISKIVIREPVLPIY